MTKFWKTTMLAAGVLIVSGVASAQSKLQADVPFTFQAGEKTMQPGTYVIERLQGPSGIPLYRVRNTELRESIVILARAASDPKKGWEADSRPRIGFACVAEKCALSKVWEGESKPAYGFAIPKSHGEVKMSFVVAHPVKGD
jgi:hypothetical protein